MALRTLNSAKSSLVCQKAEEKWKEFYSNFYDENQTYLLLYELEAKSGERTGKDSSCYHKRWLTEKLIFINNEFFYTGNILADFKPALAL